MPRPSVSTSRILAAALLFAAVAPAAAQLPSDVMPPDLEGVGVTEKLNEKIPLDLAFTDENGKPVTLAEYFAPGKPVILTINYYTCPLLCSLTLNGLVDGLNGIEWTAGNEFQIVTVSMNPEEERGLAKAKKDAYLTQYRREPVKDGWRFLIGDLASIDALCAATGFGYRKLPDGEFAHTSTIIFLTPDGRISRYMNDVLFQPRDMRLALIEASEGSIGSPLEKFALLMCYTYDPDKNSYVASAWKIMRLGGLITVALIAAGISLLFWIGPKRTADDEEAPSDQSAAAGVGSGGAGQAPAADEPVIPEGAPA